MRNASWVLMLRMFIGALVTAGTLGTSDAVAQELSMAGRTPRFLAPTSTREEPVEVDVTTVPMLTRRVALRLDSPTLGEALSAITRQTEIRFAYSTAVLPLDRPLSIRAENITVAAALLEILIDTGVDVMLMGGNRLALLKRPAARAAQSGVITGQVTDGKNGAMLGGVDVSIDGTRWRTTTDADGRYRLADVTPGSYTVLARRIGYGPERRAVTVTVGQEATVNVALQAAAARLGEVVVTAQKREERLQDVPLSVAVVTPEEIDRRGLVSDEDYLRGIPGVSQMREAFGGAIIIRGLETTPSEQNPFAGPTVATYFGETPTTTSAGLTGGANVDLKLVDIERVEVLRGPQGTAFGSSSLGGAVRTIPVAPKLDRFEGTVGAGYSVTSGSGANNPNFQAVGNFPLIKDKLALRVVGYRYEESGFYRNVAGSDPNFQSIATAVGAQAFAIDDDNVGASRFTGGRVAALFQASDNLRFTLSYLTQKTELDGNALASTGTYDQARFQVAPEHVLRRQTGGLTDTDIDLANATMEYDFGWANLLATYSYTNSGSAWSAPSIFSMLPYSNLGTSEHRAHSGEIRLTTQLDGPWNFLGGVYAENLDDEAYFSFVWFADPARNFFGPGQRLLLETLPFGPANLTQKAAFAEVSWEFVPGFTLTGGVRAYDYDRTTAGGINRGAWVAGGQATSPALATDASGTSFRGNLSHKLNDNALVYAGWAQGFRLGKPTLGLQSGACDRNSDGILDGTSNVTIESTRSLTSDNVDSYELGGKFTLLDRRLMIAADVYRIDWTDVPIHTMAPPAPDGCGLAYDANAGIARSEGVEFQANFYVTDAFRFDVGGSWIRARLTEDAPSLNAFAGARLPGSPEVNANLGLQYEFTIGGREAFVRADPIYVGPFYANLQEIAESKSGGYVKVDASARVAIRNLNVDLFVRNLTNADDFTFRGIYRGVGPFFGYRLRPRTVGLQLSHRF